MLSIPYFHMQICMYGHKLSPNDRDIPQLTHPFSNSGDEFRYDTSCVIMKLLRSDCCIIARAFVLQELLSLFWHQFPFLLGHRHRGSCSSAVLIGVVSKGCQGNLIKSANVSVYMDTKGALSQNPFPSSPRTRFWAGPLYPSKLTQDPLPTPHKIFFRGLTGIVMT